MEYFSIKELIKEYETINYNCSISTSAPESWTYLKRIELFELYHAFYIEQNVKQSLIMDNNQP